MLVPDIYNSASVSYAYACPHYYFAASDYRRRAAADWAAPHHPSRPAQIQRGCSAVLVQVGAEHSIYIHTLHTLLSVKILLFI